LFTRRTPTTPYFLSRPISAALDADITIVSPMAGIPDDLIGRLKHTTLRQEHETACAVVGATAVNGEFLDDVYPAPRRTAASEWLADQLEGADEAYIPMGIWHPDHLLTSNLLLDLIRLLPHIPDRLYFYEELPYRINFPELSNTRFAHIENNIGRLRLIEEQYPVAPKERAVRAYASQIDEPLVAKLLVRERIWELVR
jgi:LmbE family N-acetylglucosaminyl deacetylase